MTMFFLVTGNTISGRVSLRCERPSEALAAIQLFTEGIVTVSVSINEKEYTIANHKRGNHNEAHNSQSGND